MAPAGGYKCPALLEPIVLLDLLELCGNTTAAAKAFYTSQPTISRKTRSLVNDLSLEIKVKPRANELRYAYNNCLDLLRQAAQVHRLQNVNWRVGCSLWQRVAVETLQPWVADIYDFKHPYIWRELVRAHVLDAAVVSGFDLQICLDDAITENALDIKWDDCLLIPITETKLGLMLPAKLREEPKKWSEIIVPPQQDAPGLAAMVRQQQWQCVHAPKKCKTANDWALWVKAKKLPVIANKLFLAKIKAESKSWYWREWPCESKDQQWLMVLNEKWQKHPELELLLLQLREVFTVFYSNTE